MKVSTPQTKLDPKAQHLRNLKAEGFFARMLAFATGAWGFWFSRWVDFP